MNLIRTKSAACVLSAFVAAALLAACSSGGTQSASPGSGLGINSSVSHIQAPLFSDRHNIYMGRGWVRPYFHPDHRKTWISPDVQNAPRLLFAGDASTGDVDIFTMPDMGQKGSISGFSDPEGECSDSNGNIYVTDTGAEAVYKFTRDGTHTMTYDDAPYGISPLSCAVNPTNGAVAVTNLFGLSGGEGNVAVFASPSGPVTTVQNPDQQYYTFAGYDPSGDLWVDGYTTSLTFILSACGASSCSTIPISGGTIYGAGAVQWDRVRNEWVVFDSICNGVASACSYPIGGSGVLGIPTDYLNYAGSLVCDMTQGLVAADHGNKYAAGGDNESACAAGDKNTFSRWHYTDGGKPSNHTLPLLDIGLPTGVAISNKNKP
jgi:hypothetical protein